MPLQLLVKHLDDKTIDTILGDGAIKFKKAPGPDSDTILIKALTKGVTSRDLLQRVATEDSRHARRHVKKGAISESIEE